MPKLRKDTGTEQIEVPMSSMIDVVFLLLIYFIWTYQIEIPEAHLQVFLPEPDKVETTQPPDTPPVEVQVYEEGYTFRGRRIDLDRLEMALVTIASVQSDVTVVIQVSEWAPTARLVKLLDRCQEVGLKNLNVVTI